MIINKKETDKTWITYDFICSMWFLIIVHQFNDQMLTISVEFSERVFKPSILVWCVIVYAIIYQSMKQNVDKRERRAKSATKSLPQATRVMQQPLFQ